MIGTDDLEMDPGKGDDVSVLLQQKITKISSQSLVFFLGTIFTTASGYFFKIYVARTLGAEDLGLYALGMSVVAVASFWSGLGLAYTTVRFVSIYLQHGRKGAVKRFLQLCTAVSLGASLVVAAIVIVGRTWISETLLHEPRLAPLLVLFALMVPLQSLGYVMLQALRGFQEVARSTIITSFVAIPAKMAFTILAFALGWALWGYVAGELVAGFLTAVLLGLSVRTLFRRMPSTTEAQPTGWGVGREVYAYAGSMMGLGFLDVLTGQTDKFMLGAFLDARTVGIYTVALTSSAYIPLLLSSVNTIFSPIISQLNAQGNTTVLERLFQVLTKWTLALTWPLVVTVVMLAPQVMGIFGAEFVAGWPVLVVVALGQLVNVGVGSVGFMLLMSGYERTQITTRVVSAAVTFACYWLFIPSYGAAGAGVAIAVGLIAINVLNLRLVRKHLGMTPYNRTYAALILPALLVVLVVWGFRALLFDVVSPIALILIALFGSYATFVASFALIRLDDMDRMVLESLRDRLGAVHRMMSRWIAASP